MTFYIVYQIECILDMIEMEQILDMMKSDAAQDILALGYYPRSIRKAIERIFLGNKISKICLIIMYKETSFR